MNGEGTPVVSVIIPVWNRPDDIRQCLESLTRQTLAKHCYEVIVVDNGSTDDTVEVARSFGVTVLVEPQPGSYAARNRGLEAVRGQYVAFTDSDCTAHERWLEAGLGVLEENGGEGVVVGHVELVSNGESRSSLCDAYERTFAFNQERNASRGRAVTANWFSRTAIVRDAGGFRSDLKSGGDFDLARRLDAAGHPFHYARDVLVYHPARATFSELSSKARRVIGGRMWASQPFRPNPLPWWFGLGKDAARRLLILYRSKGLGLAMKLRLSALILALFGVSSLEVVNICMGRQPRRA